MGLSATIASAVAAGYAALDDIPRAATYRRRTGSTYSTSTGTDTPTYADAAVDAIVVDYSRRERADSAIQPEDRKALIQGAQLAADPAIGDQLVVAGQTLTVVGVTVDPARVVFTLQVRRAA